MSEKLFGILLHVLMKLVVLKGIADDLTIIRDEIIDVVAKSYNKSRNF